MKIEFMPTIMELSNSVVVVNPETNSLYQVFKFEKKIDKQNDCHEVCPIGKMKRFLLGEKHFTCFSCRIRRAYIGKMPLIIPVSVYTVLISGNRSPIKVFLFRKLASILEWLAN